MIVTGLWVGLFLLRLVVQVPLYLTNHVAALGVTRLLMGIPFWALAIWVSYLIIATPMHRHKVAAKKIQTEVCLLYTSRPAGAYYTLSGRSRK